MNKLLSLSFRVNSVDHDVLVPPWRTLLEVLRENLGLIGAKRSCQEGQCGACTVLIDGEPVNSCLYLAVEAQNKEILTIEGMGGGDRDLHQIQKSFVKAGAVQCGFCTPGLIVLTRWLLSKEPDPSEDEIREAIVGHLCRCTGYFQIIEAIQDAARELAKEESR